MRCAKKTLERAFGQNARAIASNPGARPASEAVGRSPYRELIAPSPPATFP
jgi:hypothetical protein